MENPSPTQVYLVKTLLGRMVKQMTPEKRVMRFLFVAIIKMDWPELVTKAKRYGDFRFLI